MNVFFFFMYLCFSHVSTQINRADVGVQTRRDSEKRVNALERRRARSANLEKLGRSELSSGDDRWITEYMRCFSARLR